MSPYAVCLACRAVLPAGAGCPVDASHRSVQLSAPADRAALIDAVWGVPAERGRTLHELQRQTRGQLEMSVAGMAMASGGALLLGSLTLAVMGGLVGAAAGHLVATLRARRDTPARPRGADAIAAPSRLARGRIRRAEALESPASGVPCAVWAIELRLEGAWGERVMLRMAATSGLDVALDGGAAARVPAGPVIAVGPMSQLDDIESTELEALLRDVDPRRPDDPEPFPPVPYNVVVEHTVVVGERVELLGDLVPGVLPTHRQRLYRDAPPTVLVPAGVPIVRVG